MIIGLISADEVIQRKWRFRRYLSQNLGLGDLPRWRRDEEAEATRIGSFLGKGLQEDLYVISQIMQKVQ